MIQVDKQIRAMIQCSKLKIEPYDEDSINPNSYDLHLGNNFQISKQNGGVNPYDERTVISIEWPEDKERIAKLLQVTA
jgi:deoxycytidine triphosphate deaminase